MVIEPSDFLILSRSRRSSFFYTVIAVATNCKEIRSASFPHAGNLASGKSRKSPSACAVAVSRRYSAPCLDLQEAFGRSASGVHWPNLLFLNAPLRKPLKNLDFLDRGIITRHNHEITRHNYWPMGREYLFHSSLFTFHF